MTSKPRLSKSKIIAGRQCERRVWLEAHRPDLRHFDQAQSARLQQGTEFGELARKLLGEGVLVDFGYDQKSAMARTLELLNSAKPPRHVFEAAVAHQNVLVHVDALRQVDGQIDLIEVKSSTRVKDYFLEDCAVQTWVTRGAGLAIRRVKLALVDRDFVYSETESYRSLLRLHDVTDQVEELLADVGRWVHRFQTVLDGDEPSISTGNHCTSPFGCPFIDHCRSQESAPTEHPLEPLPNAVNLTARLTGEGYRDLRQVPLKRLKRPAHQRIAGAARGGKAFVTAELEQTLAALPYPRRFLDFEAAQFIIPRFLGTRPFDQIPFQWSCHVESKSGSVRPLRFLDLSGDDPRRAFAESLIKAVGKRGPILVYDRSFESSCLHELARQFDDLSPALIAISERFVDLLPLMRNHYYDEEMLGSWSLKAVLPAVVPTMSYDQLGEVADGRAAAAAYLEAINPETSKPRRKALRDSLTRYCGQDTLGLLAIVRKLTPSR